MAELEVRSQDQADETRPFVGNGRVEILKLSGGTVGRGTFEPGWRWSEHVKPIAGTESCQSLHTAYCISGRMAVRMDDGTEKEIGPGDVVVIPPGHDAWVVGDEPCVQIDSPAWRSTPRRPRAGDGRPRSALTAPTRRDPPGWLPPAPRSRRRRPGTPCTARSRRIPCRHACRPG